MIHPNIPILNNFTPKLVIELFSIPKYKFFNKSLIAYEADITAVYLPNYKIYPPLYYTVFIKLSSKYF